MSLAGRFPPGFLFGAATAAYQIEGAWDADGKGPSIWDVVAPTDACEHYRRWREDVALMSDLGLGAYRFSISWSRVLPEGTGRVNEAGLAFYARLVDALLERGIRPFATLYHWDLPQALQERGGWSAPDAPAWFAEYASVVAARLGDRVHDWVTINEPEVVAFAGHALGVHPPGLRDYGVALRVAHHLLLAHRAGADAVRAAAPSPSVGIALNLSPAEPASARPEDAAAAQRYDAYLNRWFLDPLFGRGYPTELAERYGPLVPGDLGAYDGGLDFFGLNYYTRTVVRDEPGEGPLALERVPASGETTEMGWEVHPRGLYELLMRVHGEYSPPAIYVTESGAAYADAPPLDGEVPDRARTRYLEAHLDTAADALDDGVPLRGYFVWSLLDNVEWQYGTTKRFGLVYVDYATQRRIVKTSGRWYRDVIAAHRDTLA
jgi:beta-glucosidase